MKRLFKILLWLIVLLLVIGGCTFGVSKFMSSNAGNINIVIVGIDSRQEGDVARSDTIMIAHIDEAHDDIKLISIPRDSYVYIPSVGYEDKINHSYAFDGMNGLLDTLNGLFETNITYYVETDFLKTIALVDSIDGIDLTPSASFCEMNENDQADSFCFNEGESMHMNGEQALAYARHRKSDSDLYRAARQQEVIKAMVSKVKRSNPLQMYNFYNDFKKITNTNLGFQEFMKYSDLLYNGFEMSQEVAEGYSDTIYTSLYNQYISYYFIDENWLQQTKEVLRK